MIEKLYKEVWVPIQGFETSYAVSNHGRVKSLPRTRSFGIGSRSFPEVLKTITPRYTKLRGVLKKKPYNYVSLSKPVDGKTHTRQFLVSRIVAKHFLSDPAGLTVDHLDGNTVNDHVSNLEVITLKENIRRMFRDTGPRGASLARGGKWASRINLGKQYLFLGNFATKEEAQKVYFNKYMELYGTPPWEVDELGEWVGTKYRMSK